MLLSLRPALAYRRAGKNTDLEAILLHVLDDSCHWFMFDRVLHFHFHLDALLNVRTYHAVLVPHLIHADGSLRTQHRVDATHSTHKYIDRQQYYFICRGLAMGVYR